VPVLRSVTANDFTHIQPANDNVSNTKPLLLIIDDHKDIIDYLHMLLTSNYDIIHAGNGKEGYKLATEKIPDIIISDVMMPDMDGYEFLRKVKADFMTSHIPVLMLTARADRVSKLEGLSLGAEAYLVKPFDKEELFIRLRKLLEMRNILRRRYSDLKVDLDTSARHMDFEDQFIARVHQIIEANLDDEFFDITSLCRELAMSHTQLYRKFSALTDITVNKYIRRYRLHKALNLLRTKDLNVSQVCQEVGMPNPAYFSRIFTEEFGINPSKVKDHKITKEWDA
jgi:response regulator RpfG family c-di-GMP phosphodiesterase